MFVDDMVSAIVARLAAVLPSLKAEAFPDDPANYRLYHPTGAALVIYGGSRYGEPDSLGAIVQERLAEFDVTLLLRNLRGPTGANTHVDAIRLALTGFKVAGGGSKLRPVRDRFVAHDNGVWRFEITFVAAIPAIEQLEEDLVPLLKRLTFTGDDGTTEVPKEAP